MNNTNNGILTKVRAMQSKLLTEEDFSTIMSMKTVSEAIQFLKENEFTNNIFSDADDDISHREQIELLLHYSIYRDFKKLYSFAFGSDRKFLSIYFFKIEVEVLKRCITALQSSDKQFYEFYSTYEFFKKHATYDVTRLLAAKSLEEFINVLSGTKYYSLFKRLYDRGVTNLVEYKMQLDIYYYTRLWKTKDKDVSGELLDIMKELIGREIDLSNIVSIYRCKKYYDVDIPVIYKNFIVPVNYKLSRDEISSMVNASTIEDFLTIFDNTYYGKQKIKFDFEDTEKSFQIMMKSQYGYCVKKYPKTMSVVLQYIFKREQETNRLIAAIESVRYKIPAKELVASN